MVRWEWNMELDIREINSYVLALSKDNKDRRKKIKKVFENLGIKKWSFFDSIDVRNKFPYWIGCAMSHRECLATAEFPCIIYEDDIKPSEWYRPIIEDPKDKVLYLGLSKWGTQSGSSQFDGGLFLQNTKETSIVQYMCSAHAIYYPTKEVADNYSNYITKFIFEVNRPFDELYAQIQTEIKTLCLNDPIFCQDDPKTFHDTHFRLDIK